MEPETLIYKLKKGIKYSTQGKFKETATLEVKPPTIKEMEPAVRLSQLVTNAMFDARKLMPEGQGVDVENPDQQQMPTAKELKLILFASDNVDFNKIFDAFKEIALTSGTFDGKEPLKETAFDKIGMEDSILFACEYIANFIFPSLF